ncbi:MAG: hypothetical protein R6V72_03485 [Cyclobacterium sp.]|nr:hypothetical protein [Cyclobacterium sp. SYSU L10401]
MKSSLPTGQAGMTRSSHNGMTIKHLSAGRQVRDSIPILGTSYDR